MLIADPTSRKCSRLRSKRLDMQIDSVVLISYAASRILSEFRLNRLNFKLGKLMCHFWEMFIASSEGVNQSILTRLLRNLLDFDFN